MTHSFAAFCAAAERYKLTADLEFMPWTNVRDCSTALRIVQNAGQANGGVLADMCADSAAKGAVTGACKLNCPGAADNASFRHFGIRAIGLNSQLD